MKKASHQGLHVVWFHLYKMSRLGKFVEPENSALPNPGREGVREKWEVTANRYGFGGRVDGANVLKLVVGMVAQLCEYSKSYWNIIKAIF